MQKRQHTVPRCYLENFIDKDGFLWVLDIKNKIFKIKPKNILVENNFYTITLKNGEKSLVVEDTLMNIESAYASIFTNKISRDQFLTDEERAKVSAFIAALLLRTRPNRENTRKMFEKIKTTLGAWKKQFKVMDPQQRRVLAAMPRSSAKTINLADIEKYLGNFDEEHSMSVVANLTGIAQRIFNMKWSIMKNVDTGFVTCDDPVVLLRPESIKKYGPDAIGSRPGLAFKDVELTLPLSSDRLLLAGWILDQDSYWSVENEIADNINHRTITHSSERIIADSETEVNDIRAKYTEIINNQTKLKG